MVDIEDVPEWPGYDLVEAVLGTHERVLRNLCLAACASTDAEKKWHLAEADEIRDGLRRKMSALQSWLSERGVMLS